MQGEKRGDVKQVGRENESSRTKKYTASLGFKSIYKNVL